MLLSIIIPTKNRNELLLETLENALKSIQDFDAEIIVVNDGTALSNLPTNNKSITLLENSGYGVSVARNKGAKVAKGQLLFFIDDDMNITAEALAIIQKLFLQKQFDNNYFNLNWVYPKDLQETLKVKKIGRYILQSNYHTLEGRMHAKINYALPIDSANGVASCAFCISKQNFEKIGGYNENIDFQGEDIDIAIRLKNAAIHSKVVTKITCFHNQKDRLEITEYLDRIYRGYVSQAKANMVETRTRKQHFLRLFLPLFPIVKLVFTTVPNRPIFDQLIFRLIGILSSMTYLKALRAASRNK